MWSLRAQTGQSPFSSRAAVLARHRLQVPVSPRNSTRGEAARDSRLAGERERTLGRQTLTQAPQATQRAGVNVSVRTLSPVSVSAPVAQALAQAPQAVQLPLLRMVPAAIPPGRGPRASSVRKSPASDARLPVPGVGALAADSVRPPRSKPRKFLRESDTSPSRRGGASLFNVVFTAKGCAGASFDRARTASAWARVAVKVLFPSPFWQAEQSPVRNVTVRLWRSQRASRVSSPRQERQPWTRCSRCSVGPAWGQRRT